MDVETLIDKLSYDGVLEKAEEVAIQKMIDEHKRFKEFVDEMHHLMNTGHCVLDDDDFTIAISAALRKADPDYDK